MKLKSTIFILVVPVLIGFIVLLSISILRQNDQQYLREKKFQYSGFVTHKNYIESGIGRIEVTLENSNYKKYNPKKDNRRRYFCKINNGKALIIVEGVNGISIGDFIKVDKTEILIYRNKKLVRSSNIFIPIPFPIGSKIFDH